MTDKICKQTWAFAPLFTNFSVSAQPNPGVFILNAGLFQESFLFSEAKITRVVGMLGLNIEKVPLKVKMYLCRSARLLRKSEI